MTAFAHWTAMHAWWVARRSERDAIGKPWAPKAQRSGLAKGVADRLDALANHPDVEKAIADAIARDELEHPAEPRNRAPVQRSKRKAPDEGKTVDQADVTALQKRYGELEPEAKAWVGALISQGDEEHPWRIKDNHTLRRYELYRGVLRLAAAYDGDADAEVRVIVSTLVNEDWPFFENIAPGRALSLLDAEQAAKFAEVACGLTTDRYRLNWGDDGPSLESVA